MRTYIFAAISSLALAACGMQGQDNEAEAETVASADTGQDYGYETYSNDNLADTMASDDERFLSEGKTENRGEGARSTDIPDSEDRPVMQASWF